MTVIAWDGKHLVTDGRSTRGFEIVTDNAVKIKEFDHAALGPVKAAFCGAVLTVQPWIDHMVENGFAEFEPGNDDENGKSASVVMVTTDGRAVEADVDGRYHYIINPLAYGSGCTIAQHFLKRGDDALTAVRETIKSDASCGGRILAYNTMTGKYVSYAR